MIIYLVTGAYLLFFLAVYLRDRSSLVNGFLFFILMILGGLSLVLLAYDTQSAFLSALVVVLALGSVLFMMTGLFVIMVVSLINGAILLRRERRSLSNLLSLLLGLGILGWMFLNTLSFSSPLAQGLFSVVMMAVNTLLLYLLAVFSIFILSSFVYQLYHPLASPDYIIVLGSGLIRGREVPPLLAGRIDKAVRIYRRCVRRGKRPPILILSGGQGPDEAIPEGEAMRLYALGQGVEERHLLVENRSRNTYENMLFSKQLIEAREPSGKRLHILFATTNYHVFRAGLDAKKAHLRAQGVGAHTKFYFWYNAVLREYAAILAMNKKMHLACVGTLLALLCLTRYVFLNPAFLSWAAQLLRAV